MPLAFTSFRSGVPRRAAALLAATFAVTLAACASRPAPGPGTTREDPEAKLDLRELAPQVFLHTSYRVLPKVGLFPSNGLLLCSPGEGGLVDTAWGEGPTARLLDEARRRGCPVKRAILTHAHDDRAGGLSVLVAQGARAWATPATTRLLPAADRAGASAGLDTLEPPAHVTLGGLEVEVFFPGPAHSPDNVVVHVPARGVLFGGCMVKSGDASGLGNIADASLADWPRSLARLSERYAGQATIVVPGHGAPGGLALLRHTEDLLRAHAARAVSKRPGAFMATPRLRLGLAIDLRSPLRGSLQVYAPRTRATSAARDTTPAFSNIELR